MENPRDTMEYFCKGESEDGDAYYTDKRWEKITGIIPDKCAVPPPHASQLH